VSTPEKLPLPGAPDLDGARKRHPACLIEEGNPGYTARLPDRTILAAMTLEALEGKIRRATG
jgi:hypothetical protein